MDDSLVYFLGLQHEVTAVRKHSGTRKWQITLPVNRPNTVGNGGVVLGERIIVGDEDVFAISAADGNILWRFAPNEGLDVGRVMPVVWNDLVLAGSSNGYVFAIDAESGELRWKTRLATSPLVGVWPGGVADAVLYVGVTDFSISPNGEPQGSVGALDAATGSVQWLRAIPHHVDPTGPTATIAPAVAGSVVVAGARDGPLYGFDRATGDVRWSVPPLPFPHVTDPALIRDIHWLASCNGLVFVGSSSTIVLAIEPETGLERWRTPLSLSSAEPVWCDDRSVLVMRPLGGIEVLNLVDGTTRWELRVPEYDFFYGALSDGARLYVGGLEGVYALRND